MALAFFSRAHIDVSLQEGSGGIGLLFNLLYMGVPVEFLMDINSYLARDFNKGRHPAICRRFKRVKSLSPLSFHGCNSCLFLCRLYFCLYSERMEATKKETGITTMKRQGRQGFQ